MVKSDLLGRSTQRIICEPPPRAPEVPCSTCSKAVKCCDFQPFLPNFTLGALLEEGIDIFPEIPEHFFEPIGLIPARAFRDQKSSGAVVQCQFYDLGRCRIWAWRPGECSAYFCKGANQKHAFWSEKLFKVETRLAQVALLSLGFSTAFTHAQIDALNEGRSAVALEKGELSALYVKCWRWASQVDVEAVREWL